jgi:hypothetical protein
MFPIQRTKNIWSDRFAYYTDLIIHYKLYTYIKISHCTPINMYNYYGSILKYSMKRKGAKSHPVKKDPVPI